MPDHELTSPVSVPQPLEDIAAEEACLAVSLARADFLPALGPIRETDFSLEWHQAVWRYADILRSYGRAVSALTVGSALRESDPRAIQFLNEIALIAPQSHDEAKSVGERVRDLATRRRLIQLHQDAIHNIGADNVDHQPEDCIAEALLALGEMQAEAAPVKAESLEDAAGEVLARAMSPETASEGAVFSGLRDVDERIGGFMPGEFIVAAGRPGMGKSLFANRLTRTVCEAGLAVVTFQLEMTAREMTARIMADLARDNGEEIWYSTIRKGRVLQRSYRALEQAALDYTSWPLTIDAEPGLKTTELLARARAAKLEWERKGVRLGLVVVDHIGLVMPAQDRRGNKVAEMTDVSNAMKRMAKEVGCPVLGLSQLSRAVEGRDDKRPVLSDLRESGSIEQDADQVILLYREAYYLEQKKATMTQAHFMEEMETIKHTLEVNCAKVRGGAVGMDRVDIDAATGSIRDMGTF
jgi:replicative DNA helicase